MEPIFAIKNSTSAKTPRLIVQVKAAALLVAIQTPPKENGAIEVLKLYLSNFKSGPLLMVLQLL